LKKTESTAETTEQRQGNRGNEGEIILYLIHGASPISIDTLCALSGAPPREVLNVMERLKRKKVVFERKDYGKGYYFLNTPSADSLTEPVPPDKLKTILNRLISCYKESLDEGKEKTLVLAELYWKNGDTAEGLHCIKDAADILYSSGEREKSSLYFGYLLQSLPDDAITDENVTIFLDSVLGIIEAKGYMIPFPERIALLTRAEAIAAGHQRWVSLVKVKLTLSYLLPGVGEYKRALSLINSSRKQAERLGDQRLLKMANLMMVELLYRKGNQPEAIRFYESALENIEEFGDDTVTLLAGANLGLSYVICGRIARGIGMIEAVRAKARLLNLERVAIIADIHQAIILLDLRRIEEAEVYVNRLSSFPGNLMGPSLLRVIELCKAYINFTKEDYETASGCLCAAVAYSQYVGWTHQKFPWLLECLGALEKQGRVHEGITYDGEIARMMKEEDPYMRGVALRYRALRGMERGQTLNRVLPDLRNSEGYLKKAEAEIELARTRVVMGNLLMNNGDSRQGRTCLERAHQMLSKVHKDLLPKDLLPILPQEQKIEVMIDRVIDINESLGTIRDTSLFLERIINAAMDFTMATRGAFFRIKPGMESAVIASRNFDPSSFQTDEFRFIKEKLLAGSSHQIGPAAPGRTEPAISADTLHKANITSLVCMPARLGNETYGYLYLDNRLGGEAFPDKLLPYLRLLCSQIAAGFSSIALYEQLQERKDRFEDEAIFYRKEMGITNPVETIIGKSEGIHRVIEQIQQVAPTDSTVLIVGETGVGKELVAKAIHNLSQRKDGPFIPVNLAALPQELVVSELFGHEKGAFTGANERYKGRFELADRGTIFLDEIGDLPQSVQVKLLRVLQEGRFERLGSTKQIRSDFRVIAATHKDLPAEMEQGTFRQDLYYRLSVFPIAVPPLRERVEDIPLIARHFLERFSRKMGKKIKHIPGEELKKLADHRWPGNVRELEHCVEKAVILSDGRNIVFPDLQSRAVNPVVGRDLSRALADMERDHIEKALQACRWKVNGPRGAAVLLGMKPSTLFYRMKKLGITTGADEGT
jgi:transcriptional regulator with GAF, ATPase, and Fis domain/tetratricopeptide (TPR) repeat protein